MQRRHEQALVAQAVSLFEQKYGYRAVASRLNLAPATVQRWLYNYKAHGRKAIDMPRRSYDFETKLRACQMAVDEGLAKHVVMQKLDIYSLTSLQDWCRAYKKYGPDALKPKQKGRPKKPEHPVYATREEELQARIQELELELEIQKRINALVDELNLD